MARNLDPKCKQCRRIGEKLFLKGDRCFSPKCAMIKRNYPPGLHGPKGQPRLSGFGLQHREKQKAMKSYRLLENQFNNYFKKAKKIKGNTSESLIKFLEMRLDNIIYRVHIADSRDRARQIVNHGHILVNDKKVDIPSFQVKLNDIISINPLSLKNKYFIETIKKINKKDTPSWVSYIDDKNLKVKVIKLPIEKDINSGFDLAMIVEYYSQ